MEDNEIKIGSKVKLNSIAPFTEENKKNIGTVIIFNFKNNEMLATINFEKPIYHVTYKMEICGKMYEHIYELPLSWIELIENTKKNEITKLKKDFYYGLDYVGTDVDLKDIERQIIRKLPTNANICIKDEKEKCEMEINNLMKTYYEMKEIEIEKEYYEKKEKIKSEDKIQDLIQEFKTNLCQYTDCSIEDINISIDNECYTKETVEMVNELRKERDETISQLKNKCKEVKSLLEITDTYEQKIDILVAYDILDKKTKKIK